MTCDQWDVVVVPFPFTDRQTTKRRPALLLTHSLFNQNGHSILAMITSTPNAWPGDTAIQNLQPAGLSVPCLVRLKIFTLDNRLILRKIGKLLDVDARSVEQSLQWTFKPGEKT